MGKHIKQKKRYILHGRNLYHSPRLAVYHRVAVIKKENRICDSFALTVENSADFARASVREQSSVLSYTIAIRITQSG